MFVVGLIGCAAWTLAFGLTHIHTLPPHEDEVLALTVGRHSLSGALDMVLNDRGGAPLHFLVAWLIVHLGGHLSWLRVASICFATGAVAAVGLLAAAFGGRLVGLVTAILTCSSWVFLFNDVFGRMYSLFLLTSALSFLALLHALKRRTRASFFVWVVAGLATAATHPYGLLVLAAQVAFGAIRREDRWKLAGASCAILFVGLPLWRADWVLRSRYEVGVGGGGQLGSVNSMWHYARLTIGDFSGGQSQVLWLILILSGIGFVWLWRRERRAALLVTLTFAVPLVFVAVLDAGHRASPETRHLIFLLPFLNMCVAAGVVRLGSATRLGWSVPVVVAVGLAFAYFSSAHHRTAFLFTPEPAQRTRARAAAATWLAMNSSPSDVLMGYEPTFELAWAMNSSFSKLVVPRADPRLAAEALESFPKPLRSAVWLFDARNTALGTRQVYATLPIPHLPHGYAVRAFGPYLIVKTQRPVVTIRRYVAVTKAVMSAERRFGVVNADLELHTIDLAEASMRAAGR